MDNLDLATVFAAITAIGTLAVPVVVAVMAGRFNDQVKRWEANQWRNQELIKARLDYYRQLVPKLNDLRCYFVYIGQCKPVTPPAVLELKATLDREFNCSRPLFSDDRHRLRRVHGQLLRDVRRDGDGRVTPDRIRPPPESHGSTVELGWETMFTHATSETLRADRQTVRASYDRLIGQFADDIELTSSRDRYLTGTSR
jgi:hypothetical protein